MQDILQLDSRDISNSEISYCNAKRFEVVTLYLIKYAVHSKTFHTKLVDILVIYKPIYIM
jgi:hypothetical protein